jgi:hypothetical protein
MKWRGRIFKIVIGITIVFFAYKAYILFNKGDFTWPIASVPQKYISLFSDSCLRTIKPMESLPNKWRDTVSRLTFENDRYSILICKLKDTTSSSLDNYISQEKVSSEGGMPIYRGFGFGKSTFKYLPREPSQNNSSITFRYCCDSISYSMKQEDRVYFNGIFSSASICKGKSTNEDLAFIPKTHSCELSIMFLLKGKDIFFIAMTPNYDYNMDPKLLWNCVKK